MDDSMSGTTLSRRSWPAAHSTGLGTSAAARAVDREAGLGTYVAARAVDREAGPVMLSVRGAGRVGAGSEPPSMDFSQLGSCCFGSEFGGGCY
ncbi:hypothetical protein ACQJBY_042535 [Aegilops geniculata]